MVFGYVRHARMTTERLSFQKLSRAIFAPKHRLTIRKEQSRQLRSLVLTLSSLWSRDTDFSITPRGADTLLHRNTCLDGN